MVPRLDTEIITEQLDRGTSTNLYACSTLPGGGAVDGEDR